MLREPIPTKYSAIVIVRLEQRFLLVQECNYDQPWYFPAGRIEPGETWIEAAQRETLEEAGIPVILEGIIRIEYTPVDGISARVRVFFVARPQNNTSPKTIADEESLGAAWFTLEELEKLPLREQDVREICHYVAGGGIIYPLELVTLKGAPFRK
ncbi:NUDIX hydrolase [Microcoleus sp. FACHB-672]|uniref:NUDIX hydrolase n=1 Tax=Microcoleus sp. FACHB-672 TaxID=2692825 RepID=UPI0016853D55|nr:NUDIX hydrolase [Microcoleus sp. FACHB-672]MBD2042222.1 NUDIX hydrolase [Microcoleus sp. FACHB-672]